VIDVQLSKVPSPWQCRSYSQDQSPEEIEVSDKDWFVSNFNMGKTNQPRQQAVAQQEAEITPTVSLELVRL
jgi:hypothetical protein